MPATIPRAEIDAIAERYGDGNLDDPWSTEIEFVRGVVAHYRSEKLLADPELSRSRESLLAEAADLDALADRYEREGAA